jgi:hypothetical protein
LGSFRAYEGANTPNIKNIQERQAHMFWRAARIKLRKGTAMDTNTLLIIVLVIFLFGGFGYYGRGRWF